MEKTIKNIGLLLMYIVLITSCAKEEDNGGAPTKRNTFDAQGIIDMFEYIDFVDETEGYAIGQTFDQVANGIYTVLKTTGNNQWEVLNANLDLSNEPDIHPSNPLITKGGKAYYAKAILEGTGVAGSSQPYCIQLATGVSTPIEYDTDVLTASPPPPAMETTTFYPPSTQNGNIIAGTAGPNGGGGILYVYFIDISINKIVKIVEVQVIDAYKKFNEINNQYEGYNYNEYRAGVHLFSDNSFIVGPIAHSAYPSNLEYIFMKYDNNSGWSNNALTINSSTGADVMKHFYGSMGLGNLNASGIFSNRSGDEVYYIEHNDYEGITNKGKNSIYRISNKGAQVTELSLTDEQRNTRYVLMDENGVVCLLGRWYNLWTSKDKGNSWTLYNDLEKEFIKIDDVATTAKYHYITSDLAVKTETSVKAGIIRIKK